MSIEIKVPAIGESITEVELGSWLKTPGSAVAKDEAIVVIESEKATVELPAPEAGTLTKILKKQGDTVKIGEVIAMLEPGEGSAAAPGDSSASTFSDSSSPKDAKTSDTSDAPAVPAPQEKADASHKRATPVAQRILDEHHLQADQIQPTGPGGRVSKADVLRHIEETEKEQQPAQADAPSAKSDDSSTDSATAKPETDGREEQVVRMSKLRRTVAKRLVEAQQTAALLTTFNEVDMTNIMALRHEHQDRFIKKNGVKLGFMSFFAKAVIDGLKQFPQLNAQIRGEDIVYHNYHDLGLAVSTDRGLVVPVLMDADRLSFAQIELAIVDFVTRAREGKLKPDELSGGTFTITNGGVFGSLLSTPLVNPPQSGILGMHTIQQRPVALAGEVVIRPMMYIALTYDHRIVDGREAVLFLLRIKETAENPTRILLEV